MQRIGIERVPGVNSNAGYTATPGRALSCALLAVVTALAAVPTARADNAPPSLTPPKAYYLALGDSLAYGFQQAKFDRESPNIDSSTFDTGYVDDFAARMAHLGKGLAVVNLGCPEETSDSMIHGGPTPATCGAGFPRVWLHRPYTEDSQLDAAAAFLVAHAKQTSPVTIDIGGADVLATEQQCATANGGTATPAFLQCLQTQEPITIAHVAHNLSTVLRRVSAAAPATDGGRLAPFSAGRTRARVGPSARSAGRGAGPAATRRCDRAWRA